MSTSAFLFRAFQHEYTAETRETIHSYGCVGVLEMDEIKKSAFAKKQSPVVDDNWVCADFSVTNAVLVVPEDVLKFDDAYYRVMSVALNLGANDTYNWQVSTRKMQIYEFTNHIIYDCSSARG